jgi:hypothetical protein
MNIKIISFFIFFLFLQSQNTVKVIPSKEYEAGWIHRFFFGDHWRDLWTSEINVPVLDLEQFEGGLIAYKKGGGFQTKSLRFKSKSGKIYKFRSINKDPKKVLDPVLQESFVADIVQDQISTSHPMAAVITAPLLSAVGILNAEPIIVYLPDHDNLAAYREEFAGLLGTLEEHPDDYDNDLLNFANSDKIKSTFDLFDKMRKSSKHQFDQNEYLKARLMDFLLGDWDRHQDQWKWAGFKNEDNTWTWKAIPRDRDQAFSRYDGIIPRVAARVVPQIESFDSWYPLVENLSWSGRYVDRRVLNKIKKTEWDSICQFIQNKISNREIELAARKMPELWFQKEGKRLINLLKIRRDHLHEISEDFYNYMFEYVHIYGSNDEELLEIKRLNKDETLVQIYDYKKKKKGKGRLIYDRNFKRSETKEIRIFLDNGNDITYIQGDAESGIEIHIVGDKGEDSYLSESTVKSKLLGIFPVKQTKTYIYDEEQDSKLMLKDDTKFIHKKMNKFNSPEERYEPKVHDYGYDWKWGSWSSYNDEDGIILGTGAILYHYKLFNDPYDYRLSARAAYSSKSKSPHFELAGKFYEWVKGYYFDIKTLYSELDFNRFYGLGNNFDIVLDDENSFYLTKQTRLQTDIAVFKEYDKYEYGLTVKFVQSKFDRKEKSILNDIDLQGLEKMDLIGFKFTYRYNSVKKLKKFPRSGYFTELTSSYWPELKTRYNFREFSADLRSYSKLHENIEFSNRFYLNKIWGKYPFFFSRFLGESQILRGFPKERYAGDLAIVFNQEFKLRLFQLKIIIPGEFGFQAFHDLGRVYLEDDINDNWHYNYGFGFWLSYFNDDIFLNPAIAFQKNDSRFLFQFGYSF